MTAGPGPARGALRLRLAVSLAGLGLLAAVFALAPVEGMARVEVAGIAGLFFGLSAAHAARGLMRR